MNAKSRHGAMARTKLSKQLSEAEIERFLVAAEALHWSIVEPFISPHCEHCRQTRVLHEVLLKAVREVTGRESNLFRGTPQDRCGPLRLGSAYFRATQSSMDGSISSTPVKARISLAA